MRNETPEEQKRVTEYLKKISKDTGENFWDLCENQVDGIKVNICGIPHKVVECEDRFNTDCHFGQIDYRSCEIRINRDMTLENKKETLCHEMVHGILVHLGYNDLANNEQLVQALGNAIYQSFDIKAEQQDVKK